MQIFFERLIAKLLRNINFANYSGVYHCNKYFFRENDLILQELTKFLKEFPHNLNINYV